ncbi:TrkH family potassium uptake protein [Aquicoccus sp. G2-2]|uniref:TrkH family potassium uptake protein n=1 Tax=Aquicoccus sp. G2-2 TaxID=3092120 RepID=UPI003671E9E9
MAGSLVRRFGDVPPPLILALLYAALIAAGTLVLMLPISRSVTISWSDALFTATSAVTVTGLSVIDIGRDLTLFGQAAMLVMFQLGGLGLMTFAVLVLAALGRHVGVTGHIYLREELNQDSMHQLTHLVRDILKVVLICEGVGAMALMLSFVPVLGFWPGLWAAVFHSVSAFNNAGFSTFDNSLTAYAGDPVVNLTIPALFIIGGIGYVVLLDVFRKRNWLALSLHSKIMLTGTGILIPASFAMFALLEWYNPGTLGRFDSVSTKLMVSWFQGVTTRTAGFNTTDISAIHDSTALLMIALMLVGGGPTSTAGGIKVTTLVVMILATVAFFRRQSQLHAFGRSIGLEQVLKVMALTAISMVLIFTAIFLMTLAHDGEFLDIVFEVVSAFGTVGMSRGITGDLSELGRAIIIMVMFIGRVGPLTLGFFLATRSVPRVRYPEGQIHLG